MRLDPLYRASMYVMLTLATTLLSINAQDYNRFTMLYPLAVGLAGVAAFLTVDRNPGLGLARDLANFLGLGSFVVAMMEYWADPSTLILSLGHWLVYLTLVKMFLPKTVEDDWFLFLLGLVQVVIGVVLSQSTEVGALLLAWALTSLWTLGLFHLHREASREPVSASVTITPAVDRRDPYPGLFNLGFILSTSIVALTTLTLGGLIFLLIPRWSTAAGTGGAASQAKDLTGFSDEVQLGRMGEILENDAVVMSVELFDLSGRRVRPDGEPLWRGVTLDHYRDGRWSRTPTDADLAAGLQFPSLDPSMAVRQRVQLEPSRTDALFALSPIFEVPDVDSVEVMFNRLDGTIYRRDLRPDSDFEEPGTPRGEGVEYEVVSSLAGGSQPFETLPGPRRLRTLLDVPRDLAADLDEYATMVLADRAGEGPGAVARVLEGHLRDSGAFGYTLTMTRVDRTIDPVLDFLVNRREGHCEYFASALALMLRTRGIPSRVVNGFKGGDYNEIFGAMTVREKHAHSWVEALIDRGRGRRPDWIVLDPTPALARDRAVAKVGNVAAPFRTLSDAFRQFWAFKVIGFDRERQMRYIYGPIRELAGLALVGFGLMREALFDSLRWLKFERPGEFFSLKGFAVSVVAMLLMVGAFAALRSAWRRLIGRLRGPVDGDPALASAVAFYHRLNQLLASAGLKRPPGETPREFAVRAANALVGRLGDGEPLSEVPSVVVDAFYRVRFGQHALDPEVVRALDQRLDALEERLRPARG